MSELILEAFNKQINKEIFSEYLYLSMAAYFEEKNLKGIAHWMLRQAEEERGHAMRFFKFIHERRGKVTLTAIEAPKHNWVSPLEAFQDAYKHECEISSSIHKLVEMATREKDYPALSFLQWFINEQVEEEASVDEIVNKLTLIEKTPALILVMDEQLGKRK